MGNNFWDGKRRWVALLALLAGFFVMLRVPPVIPVIQLPGEVYPNSTMTNTLMASIVVWILLFLLIFYIRSRRPKSGAEVPPGGFYHLFEVAFEGLYNFIENIAGGPYMRPIFGMFMTIFLIVLLSNWLELVPTIDSVGFIEGHYDEVVNLETGETAHVPTDGYEIYRSVVGWALNGQCPWIGAQAEAEADAAAYNEAVLAAETAREEAIQQNRVTMAEQAAHGGDEEHADEGEAAEGEGEGEDHGEAEGEAESALIDPDEAAQTAFDEVETAYVAGKEGRRGNGCYTGVGQVAWSTVDAENFADADESADDHAEGDEAAGDEEHAEGDEAADEDHEDEIIVSIDTPDGELVLYRGTEPGHAESYYETGHFHVDPANEQHRREFPFVVLPFLRVPSTDLNMTVSLALIAVVMIQVMGFRALGLSYLSKFFAVQNLFKSPLGGIDLIVGILELVGEFAKILSFSFRLLGNIFAGSILLFVMSFLVPFLPWPFFILEFFVGIIQALVFGLLTAIFMNLATVSHHHDDHEEGHEH